MGGWCLLQHLPALTEILPLPETINEVKMSISNALFALILLVGISLLFLDRESPEAPELAQLKEQPPHDLSTPDTALIVQGRTTY